MLRFLPLFVISGFFLELAAMIAVGREIGVLATLLLVIVACMAGTAVIRSAGLSMADALRRPQARSSFASRDAGAGFLYLLAGLLLILPGFLSDIAALILLIAPIRRWLAGRLVGSLAGRVNVETAQWPPPRDAIGPVIEGEAVEIEGEITDRH